MHKVLFVGDVHATPEELGDCRKLISYVIDVANEHVVDEICFLGDQHHTHAVLRSEVIDFWIESFRRIRAARPRVGIVCLVGNHDLSNDTSSGLQAMMCYGGSPIIVIDKPTVRNNVLYMPYYADLDRFVADCCAHQDIKSLVCHQTFVGAKYENGYPARDGVDVSLIPQTEIFCGHIHTKQEFSSEGRTVTYLGSPRWRIKSDENVEKGIWVVEKLPSGLNSRKPLIFHTDLICSARYRVSVKEGGPEINLKAVEKLVQEGHRVAVDVEGSPGWVDKVVADVPQGALVRALRIQESTPKVRESDGIEVSFGRFLGGFQSLYGTTADRFKQLAKERLNVG